MKKISIKILVCILSCIVVISAAESGVYNIANFTHPEIGELIMYYSDNGFPYFTIYQFVQYRIMNPYTAYRGIQKTAEEDFVSFENSMFSFFNSFEKGSSSTPPVVFKYKGILSEYASTLSSLDIEDKVHAIKLISGFEGKQGITLLKSFKGFEELDFSELEKSYEEYTIEINGKVYPYRVLMFYIEEEDWQESYYERYAYIQDEGIWKLSGLTKEYASDYRQRNQYIHGLPMNAQNIYDDITHEAMRSNTWFTTLNQVSMNEHTEASGNVIQLIDTSIYRLSADLTYTYDENGWLSSIEYELRSIEAYYSAFVSLYMRYYDPTYIADGIFTWSLPDTQIELVIEQESTPVLRFSPRINQEISSVG